MKKIEVAILNNGHSQPGGMMMFLASLTQRGHSIGNMSDLLKLYTTWTEDKPMSSYPYIQNKYGADIKEEDTAAFNKVISRVAALPHGTIKRFAPITIAIVGASGRFLAQARTNQVGIDYVSASLQYSDYSEATEDNFVIPYEFTEADAKRLATSHGQPTPNTYTNSYLRSCQASMETYAELAKEVGNDAAGYAAPRGLRNILIMQGNHQSWEYFIRLRSCNRNTLETQYVAFLIWEAVYNSHNGPEFFELSGPDCLHGKCHEGKMCCGKPFTQLPSISNYRETRFPLLWTGGKPC